MNKVFLEMYSDYRNNFLTIERFAEYYGISEKLANEIINECRDFLSLNQEIDYLHKGYKDGVVFFKDLEVLKKGEKLNSACCIQQLMELVQIEGEITISQSYLNLANNVKQGYFVTNEGSTTFIDAINQCVVNVEFINFNRLK